MTKYHTESQKMKLVHTIVENNGDISALNKQLEFIWNKIKINYGFN